MYTTGCNAVFFRSYGYNQKFLGFNAGGPSMAAIQSPSETLMLADDMGINSPGAGYYVLYSPSYFNTTAPHKDNPWWDPSFAGVASVGRIVQRHFDGANVLYVDGHAKWSKLPGPLTTDDTLWDLQ